MSKRRKYDLRNKRSFIVILVLSILIIGIFSLFIYNYMKASKIEYLVETGSVLQDTTKNYFTLEDDMILKVRWDGSYYLKDDNERINLGKKVITYNKITGSMKLYGTFYEINSDGKVISLNDETELVNTTDSKFYKIDDREYLLVDSKIYSNDSSIEASNYLLVELDKAGNAKLSNDKINLKTISPTTLVTSKYSFDIANEILKYGDYEIDLKKIIGSSNQYVPDDKGNSDSTNNNSNVGNGTENSNNNNNLNINSPGIGSGIIGSGGTINNTESGEITDIEDIMDKVKMTSIIRVIEGINQIDVDYVIYDPYNEYKSVYVELVSAGKVEVIYLSKNDTHITLTGLKANTSYRLNFVYTISKVNTENEENELVPYTFAQFDLKTRMPEYSISVYKISTVSNKLTYKVNIDSSYNISKVLVNLSFDYEEINPETTEITTKRASIDSEVMVNDITSGYVLGNIDISSYEIQADTKLMLTIKSVVGEEVLPVNETYTFRFGR